MSSSSICGTLYSGFGQRHGLNASSGTYALSSASSPAHDKVCGRSHRVRQGSLRPLPHSWNYLYCIFTDIFASRIFLYNFFNFFHRQFLTYCIFTDILRYYFFLSQNEKVYLINLSRVLSSKLGTGLVDVPPLP